MSKKVNKDRKCDLDEKRREALWGPVIARFHETGDPTECLDLHDRGIERPRSCEADFMSALRNKRVYEKMGRKEKQETFDEAYRNVRALYEARRIRDTEGIPLRAAFERTSKLTGVPETKLWSLQEGDGTKKEKIALRQMKILTGQNIWSGDRGESNF